MALRSAPILLAASLLAAAGFAIASSDASNAASSAAEPRAAVANDDSARVAFEAATNGKAMPEGHPATNDAKALPEGHPPIDAASAPASSDASPAAVAWKAPAGFREAPSPSSFRLATYRVSLAGRDDAELSVSRAGGSTEANIERWIGQFDDAGKDERSQKTVRGMKVTIVEVSGTYLGGGMRPDEAAQKRAGWSLLGAIVEGEGTPYFFKLVGPRETVRSARAAFLAMLDDLRAP